MTTAPGTRGLRPDWSFAPGMRAVVDGLSDALFICDLSGTIRYVNPAAEDLLGWPPGRLEGQPAAILVPGGLPADAEERFASFVRASASHLAGRQAQVSLQRRDGGVVVVDVGLSVVDHPVAGSIAIAIVRPHNDRQLRRWSLITAELLETLRSAPADENPAAQLLAILGRRLGWEVATLWTRSPDGATSCRHTWTAGPDTAPNFIGEKAEDPTSGAQGVPGWVFEHDEPLWIPDFAGDPRATESILAGGIKSAYAFPVRSHGVCIGVVKLLSQRRREPDPSLVELTSAVSDHLGEILRAAAEAAEREQLVAELEEVRRAQEFLLLASRILSQASDYRETVQRLAQVSVPLLADLCLIDIREADGEIRRMAAWHADPAKRALTEVLRHDYPPVAASTHPSVAVMRIGRSQWSAEVDEGFLAAISQDERHLSILKALGFTSYMAVPLGVDGGVLGTVTLISAGSGRHFGERDLSLAEELARQVESVVERARIFDRQQQISHTLQRGLLPERFPQITGWSFGARYLPAAEEAEVGGDWFDVIRLSEDSVALVVGDVEGHDLEAAKLMGRLRHVFWLLILEEQAPDRALERLNQFLLASSAERIATVLAVVLDVERGTLSTASAGHPPPLVVGKAASRELFVRTGPPLGIPSARYREAESLLGTDCLLMFTDGLIERRQSSLGKDMERLRDLVDSAPSNEPELLVDHVLTGMLPDGSGADDVALLAVQRIRP